MDPTLEFYKNLLSLTGAILGIIAFFWKFWDFLYANLFSAAHNLTEMNPTKIATILGLLVVLGCNDNPPGNLEVWKQEVADTEKAFNDMAQEKGLVEAFEHFAAEDGVIRRSRKIVKGKDEIRKWYEKDVRPNETLTWSPTFIDVSKSGDLAYTYGDFTFTFYDSLGNEKKNQGIFHTVWKRQADNSWRFVWD